VSDQTVLEAVVLALQKAAEYDKNDQAAPAAVLWPDKNREWEPLVGRLQSKLPLLAFGAHEQGAWKGPAIWLRCALAGEIEGVAFADGEIPIVYFPGVGRDELRSLEDMDPLLQPIAELQYCGTYWSHPNGRDWTIAGFLRNKEKGLGLDVKDDAATLAALARALNRLADESVDSLGGQRLGAEDFDALLSPDSRRSLLQWMNDADGFRAGRDEGEWGAFGSLCKKEYGLHPDGDGVLSAAEHMGGRRGAWAAVWDRYAEAPDKYPNMMDLLRRAQPPELVDAHRDSWPVINDEAEATLRKALASLSLAKPDEARAQLAELEAQHGERRGWLWGCLGHAPLAYALKHLIQLAEVTADGWKYGDTASLAKQYVDSGWRADDALLRSLAAVEKTEDVAAVKVAADVLYRVWLEEGATALQAAAADACPTALLPETSGVEAGTCVLFSDGLRVDVAQRLLTRLEESGCTVELEADIAALPPVTSTAKPAVSPVSAQLGPGSGLDPATAGAQSKLTADALRKLITAAGWQVLGDEGGDPSGRAWTECGDIDEFGHSHGWKLAREVDREVNEIAQRVESLVGWGWKRVVVVTDHGWLLVPGGLPKVELSEHLTEQRKGRCARLKPDVPREFLTLPWRWDASVNITYAPGISTFVVGQEYDHGGISPQECVSPRLTVTKTASAATASVEIKSITWMGQRCRVQVGGGSAGLRLDVRTKAADAGSTLATSPKEFEDDAASLLVKDDDKLGSAAFAVLLDSSGAVIKQVTTVVGGEA
jgi:hypothetical protein